MSILLGKEWKLHEVFTDSLRKGVLTTCRDNHSSSLCALFWYYLMDMLRHLTVDQQGQKSKLFTAFASMGGIGHSISLPFW